MCVQWIEAAVGVVHVETAKDCKHRAAATCTMLKKAVGVIEIGIKRDGVKSVTLRANAAEAGDESARALRIRRNRQPVQREPTLRWHARRCSAHGSAAACSFSNSMMNRSSAP